MAIFETRLLDDKELFRFFKVENCLRKTSPIRNDGAWQRPCIMWFYMPPRFLCRNQISFLSILMSLQLLTIRLGLSSCLCGRKLK